jgi:uncharacterized protein
VTQTSDSKPGVFLRIAQFPLVRLIVLGGGMFFLMGVKNGFSAKYADAPWLNLTSVVAMSALGLALYAGFVRFIERRPVNELSQSGLGRELGAGLLVGAGLYGACVLILMLLGIYRIEGLNPWQFMLPAVAMAIGSGVVEELVFRGALFRIVEDWLGSWIALLVSSLVFGFVHLSNPQATVLGALFISVEAGLLLAAAYMATRRLWLSIGFHMAWNYTQSGIFSGAVSGNDSAPGLVKSTIQGPDLLTGGSFGMESSLIAFLLCTTAGVVLLLMAVRRGNVRSPFWRRQA